MAVARKHSVFELREELSVLLQEHNPDVALLIADEIWLGKLAHLEDMFNLLHQINLSFQKRDISIFPKLNFKLASYDNAS